MINKMLNIFLHKCSGCGPARGVFRTRTLTPSCDVCCCWWCTGEFLCRHCLPPKAAASPTIIPHSWCQHIQTSQRVRPKVWPLVSVIQFLSIIFSPRVPQTIYWGFCCKFIPSHLLLLSPFPFTPKGCS